MRVAEHASASAFLDATLGYRSADPVRSNLLGSIAQGVVEGRRYDSELWLTVEDPAGSVMGAALRTEPFSLVLGPMPEAAARMLGEHLRPRASSFPGASGPETAVMAVVSALGRPWRLRMRDVLRVLDRLIPPPPADGRARRAAEGDLALVMRWQVDFLTEVGLPVNVHDETSARAWLSRLWLWEAGGRPVAMAGQAPLVSTPRGAVGRIGPVYTVPAERGRGFGAAITAVVAGELLAHDALVMLFADAANPTSNRIYERMGFVEAGEHVEIDLL